jgi:hypothetical protein
MRKKKEKEECGREGSGMKERWAGRSEEQVD